MKWESLGQANYIHSLASVTSSKYMRAGGNFTKRDHEIFIAKINILVIYNVFTKFSGHENWSGESKQHAGADAKLLM